MGDLGLRDVDWLNANATRNYPIIDGATRIAAAGNALPRGLVVDMTLSVPASFSSPDQMFIHSVAGFGPGFIINVGNATEPNSVLATATIFRDGHTLNKSYPLTGIDSLDGSIGRIYIGTADAVNNVSHASYSFSETPDSTRLLASVIRPALVGIAGIGVGDGFFASGNVIFEAGNNTTITQDGNTIIIGSTPVVINSATDNGCDCPDAIDDLETGGTPVYSINGVLPDEDGNLQISGGTNVNIVGSAGRLTIEDEFATPCCGCDELEQLTDGIQALENEALELRENNKVVAARQANMSSVISNASLNLPNLAETNGNGTVQTGLFGGEFS